MIDIQQLKSLISAFRVETEKESISPETVGSISLLSSVMYQLIKVARSSAGQLHTLRYNFYQGTRQMKLLDSHQIRQVLDVCIFEINGLTVFLLAFWKSASKKQDE